MVPLKKLQQRVRKLLTTVLVRFTSLEEIFNHKLKKLHPVAPETIATPEVKQMPSFHFVAKDLWGDTYTTPDIYTVTLNGVLYCPTQHEVLLTKSRKIILESCLFASRAKESGEFYLEDLYRTEVEKILGYCSLFRNRRSWAHTLIHNIPRCYLLNQSEYANFEQIKLLYSGELTDNEKFFVPKLVPSNVVMTSVPRGRLYHIEKLIFPSFLSSAGSGYLPSQFIEKFRAEFLPQRPPRKDKRIFISRAKYATSSKRHIINEEELFNELQKVGFQRCMPEDMTILAQIELFYDAETVVGAHGAGLSNVLFSQNINVLELYPMKDKMRPFFYYLSKSLGHHHYCWYGNSTKFFDNFGVDVQSLLKLLFSFLH